MAVSVDQFAGFGAQASDGGVFAFDGDTEDVDGPLVASRLDRFAALAVKRFDGLESIPKVRRTFEVLLLSSGFHLST